MNLSKQTPSLSFKTHFGIHEEDCQNVSCIPKLQFCHNCLWTRGCGEDSTSLKWESQLEFWCSRHNLIEFIIFVKYIYTREIISAVNLKVTQQHRQLSSAPEVIFFLFVSLLLCKFPLLLLNYKLLKTDICYVFFSVTFTLNLI